MNACATCRERGTSVIFQPRATGSAFTSKVDVSAFMSPLISANIIALTLRSPELVGQIEQYWSTEIKL